MGPGLLRAILGPMPATDRLLRAASEACALIYADVWGDQKPSREDKLQVVARLRAALREVDGRG